MDAALVHVCVTQAFLDGVHAFSEKIHAQFLEARARDRRRKVHSLKQGVQLDRRLSGRRQRPLGALARGAQPAQRSRRRAHVLLVFSLEFLYKMRHEALVKILSSKVSVACGGPHFEKSVIEGQYGHVKRSSTQVKDEHVALGSRRSSSVFRVEAIRDRRGGWLVDDAQHFQSRDHAGVLGGLALGIVKVRWHRDDCAPDLLVLAHVRLRNLLHLYQHHGRYLFGLEDLVLALVLDRNLRHIVGSGAHRERPQLDIRLDRRIRKLTTNQTLRVKDRVLWIGRHLVLGRISDETLRVRKGYVRGSGSVPLVIRDDLHAVILPHSDAAVRCPEVNTYRWSLALGHFFLIVCCAVCAWVVYWVA